jgi:hypothetical protein
VHRHGGHQAIVLTNNILLGECPRLAAHTQAARPSSTFLVCRAIVSECRADEAALLPHLSLSSDSGVPDRWDGPPVGF